MYEIYLKKKGAIKSGEFQIFEIVVPKNTIKVNLVMIHDDGTVYDIREMHKLDSYNDGVVYSLAVHFPISELVWYYFDVKAVSEHYYIGRGKYISDIVKSEIEPKAWQITVYSKDYKTPEWIKGGLYYHVFIDRFNSSRDNKPKIYAIMKKWGEAPSGYDNDGHINFYGGDLKGIIKKLDYLKELGVTCLYLSPIFKAHSNHKYDAEDYLEIDSMFGTKTDFKRLCRMAHKQDIKVILDCAFNHVGSTSKYFNDEKYSDWFTFREDGTYECWWNFDTLPSIKKNTPSSFKEYICGEHGVISTWLKLGADGVRLDVADELSNELLDAIREAVKREKEDGIVIGEVWEDASYKEAYGHRRRYFLGKQLDSVMNYVFKDAIIKFAKGGKAEELNNTILEIQNNYPKESIDCLMNNVGTHDTERILTMLNEDVELLKMVATLQYTLIGVPCVYYGDEDGIMLGGKDPENRKCKSWNNRNEDVFNHYKRLGEIRKNEVFKNGFYCPIYAHDGVLIFSRYNKSQEIIIALNASNEAQKIDINRIDIYRNLLTDSKIEVNPIHPLVLQPKESVILQKIK